MTISLILARCDIISNCDGPRLNTRGCRFCKKFQRAPYRGFRRCMTCIDQGIWIELVGTGGDDSAVKCLSVTIVFPLTDVADPTRSSTFPWCGEVPTVCRHETRRVLQESRARMVEEHEYQLCTSPPFSLLVHGCPKGPWHRAASPVSQTGFPKLGVRWT